LLFTAEDVEDAENGFLLLNGNGFDIGVSVTSRVAVSAAIRFKQENSPYSASSASSAVKK
jgi:hypothetical protein